jgi:hypothetical protein
VTALLEAEAEDEAELLQDIGVEARELPAELVPSVRAGEDTEEEGDEGFLLGSG